MAPSFRIRTSLAGWIALAATLTFGCSQSVPNPAEAGDVTDSASRDSHLTILLVLDGLRPDYVTPEIMPRLARLRSEGVWGRAHHAVFPTLTRVNAPSISTGTRPGLHGLMENSVFVPELPGGEQRVINTGDADALRRAEAAIAAPLLQTPDLAEILSEHGKVLMVASSGSSGSAYLLNHRTPTGPILNTELTLPASMEGLVLDSLGAAPPADRPNLQRNRRAVDAFLGLGLSVVQPQVVLMWLSDPDNTAHYAGIGTDLTLEALAAVDAEVGRMVDALRARGLWGQVDLIITSDHGFSTHVGTVRIDQFLVDQGLKRSLDSEDVVVAGGGIHVLEGGPGRVLEIAARLQGAEWAGALFSRGADPGSMEGWVPGTLSYESIRYDHARAPDLYVSANWSDDANDAGWTGSSWQVGTAGHGTSSPWDIHATLLAVGPSFKSAAEIPVPTGHHDLAPTILRLQGVPVPPHMEGRVLTELFRGSPDPDQNAVARGVHSVHARHPGGEYSTTLHHAEFQGSYYVTKTVTERTP